VRVLPAAVFGGWLLFSLFTFPQQGAAPGSWLMLIEIAARYLLAAPGAALSGLAILAQGEELRHLRRQSLNPPGHGDPVFASGYPGGSG